MKIFSRKTDSMPGAFKAGAISLAFLIIGYQSALFVNRAAELRIESVRDHPDTVFISRTDTVLKQTEHSVKVEQVRRKPEAKPFRFNPNTASMDDFMRLGFSQKQAQSIINYREKGGRYRRKSDFASSFVVSDEMFRKLESYIDIPLLDINKADSAAFDALPGIGPYFASRMVSYRKELGGYSYPEQLMDIYRLDQERYNAFSDLITCTPQAPYDLWKLPAEELARHPYIKSIQAARAIVLYRENTPPEELSVEGIAKAGILDADDAAKLARCLISSP